MGIRQSRFSAGIVPVYLGSQKPLYLILRLYSYWDFPKGGVMIDEEPLQGALRELEEETTLQEADFRWGTSFLETPPYGQGKIARYYVAQMRTQQVMLPVSPELGRPEHHEFLWCDYDEARRRLPERLKAILDWAHGLVE